MAEEIDAEAIATEDEVHKNHEIHVHGPACGHVSLAHEDHIDYFHDGHRHFERDGKWFHHTEAEIS